MKNTLLHQKTIKKFMVTIKSGVMSFSTLPLIICLPLCESRKKLPELLWFFFEHVQEKSEANESGPSIRLQCVMQHFRRENLLLEMKSEKKKKSGMCEARFPEEGWSSCYITAAKKCYLRNEAHATSGCHYSDLP